MSCNDVYVPYCGVCLASILEHSNVSKNYDIIILNRDISEENKRKLQGILEHKENMHLRFINPMSLFHDVTLNVTYSYFSEENYFQLTAALLLKNYKKIIYPDVDMIVLDDLLQLAEIDMGEKVVGMCLEPIWKELYLDNKSIKGQSIKDYTDNVLQLPHPTEYFNAGLCVFDVEKYNQMGAFEKMKEAINTNDLIYMEQCALNMCLAGRIYRLPDVWNFELGWSILHSQDKHDFYREYVTQEKDAKIMHFLGSRKPWKNPLEYKADLWWNYASRTPFFAEILARLVDLKVEIAVKPTVTTSQTASTTAQSAVSFANVAIETAKTGVNTANSAVHTANEAFRSTQLAYVSSHLLLFRCRKWRYQVKKTLLSGDKRLKYLDKYRAVRDLIKESERFRKKMSEV
jgi:lipopolysaccharide biosynthesis glycosyltransferase